MNEEAYHNGSGMDLWIGLDWIWYPELWMRSVNVWDMTDCFFNLHITSLITAFSIQLNYDLLTSLTCTLSALV
jgi:hypothetical protein